jgi:hypothetical protein
VFHPDLRTTAVLDLRDGRVVAGPWEMRSAWFVAGTDRHAIAFGGPQRTTLVDLSTGRETLDPDRRPRHRAELIHALPDGTFLVVRTAPDVMTRGRTLRRVPAGAVRGPAGMSSPTLPRGAGNPFGTEAS